MSTNPYYNLGKTESLAVLDGHNARDSAATAQDPFDLKRNANETPPVALDLSIRRVRLALLTVVMVAAITALMIFFNRGVEVSRFDARTKNSTQQNKLLDDYNSYSGNISSAFGKPIEIFVAIAVQILVLRFMITSMLKPELSWKVGAVTLALMTAIGYLISNGFNALNVQLRPLEIEPVISAADLAYETAGNVTATSTDPSSIAWTKTVSENAPKNPINNTILRQVVNTRVQKSAPLCNWMLSMDTGMGMIPDTTMDFGFTQRDWQKRVLEEALEPKQLRLVTNATDKTANKNVKVSDLPMNASLAADMFIYGWLTVQWLANSVGTVGSFSPEMNQTNPTASSQRPVVGPTALLAGLLPPTQQRASEMDQRNWFLQKFPPILSRTLDVKFDSPFSSSDIVTEFSHVDISESIKFDSVTFELEVMPDRLGNATSSGRKTKFLQERNCGPWPALCLVEKAPLFDISNLAYDVPVQVGAFAACARNDGTEGIDTTYTGGGSTFECPQRSKSSLMIVSVGKRLVADSIQQNADFDATANYAKNGSVVVKNLRKIYSFTVGRLSWKTQNLANDFNAECATTNCDGLHLPLAAVDGQNNAAAQTSQKLVVGRDALPLSSLPALGDLYKFRPRILSLIQINELPRLQRVGAAQYGPTAGDPLLLHNIKALQWETRVISNEEFYKTFSYANGTCDTFIEDRLYLTVKNHMYMEYSLQPAYTAATFFLFQNGVVKDTVKLKADRTSLNFEKNKQQIAVWASIPDQNAWLTLGGCIVVVLSLGAVLLSSMCKRQQNGSSLAAVTEPHVIARVMLDEAQFPPMVLHRRVVGTDRVETSAPRQLDAFVIDGLSLQHQEDLERATFAGKGLAGN